METPVEIIRYFRYYRKLRSKHRRRRHLRRRPGHVRQRRGHLRRHDGRRVYEKKPQNTKSRLSQLLSVLGRF